MEARLLHHTVGLHHLTADLLRLTTPHRHRIASHLHHIVLLRHLTNLPLHHTTHHRHLTANLLKKNMSSLRILTVNHLHIVSQLLHTPLQHRLTRLHPTMSHPPTMSLKSHTNNLRMRSRRIVNQQLNTPLLKQQKLLLTVPQRPRLTADLLRIIKDPRILIKNRRLLIKNRLLKPRHIVSQNNPTVVTLLYHIVFHLTHIVLQLIHIVNLKKNLLTALLKLLTASLKRNRFMILLQQLTPNRSKKSQYIIHQNPHTSLNHHTVLLLKLIVLLLQLLTVSLHPRMNQKQRDLTISKRKTNLK
jgi:hypothetical protein